jgi:hypothetical protein
MEIDPWDRSEGMFQLIEPSWHYEPQPVHPVLVGRRWGQMALTEAQLTAAWVDEFADWSQPVYAHAVPSEREHYRQSVPHLNYYQRYLVGPAAKGYRITGEHHWETSVVSWKRDPATHFVVHSCPWVPPNEVWFKYGPRHAPLYPTDYRIVLSDHT